MIDFNNGPETLVTVLYSIDDVNELRRRISEANIEKGLWFQVFQPTELSEGWKFCIVNTWGTKVSTDTAFKCLEIATGYEEECTKKFEERANLPS